MAIELAFVVLTSLAAAVADTYITQESSQCSGAALTACSTHHLSCPADGQVFVVALSRAVNGFRLAGTSVFCSYAFDCSDQQMCCANNALKFCFENFATEDLTALGRACLGVGSCQFRSPVARFNRTHCGRWANQRDSAMSAINYFCIPASTILTTLSGYQSAYNVPGASIMYKKSLFTGAASDLTHSGTCTILSSSSSSGREILVSLYLYAVINGPQSQKWHVRVEDTRNAIDVSPYPGAMTVLTEKKSPLLLTPVTIHVSLDYTGVPDLLWLGFEVAGSTDTINIRCWPNYDDTDIQTARPLQTVTTVQSSTETSRPMINKAPSTTTTTTPSGVSDDGVASNYTLAAAASSGRTSKDFGNTTGLIIGTVVGATLLVSLAAGFLYVVWRRHRNKSERKERYRRTLTSSTVLDDCGYCVPVTPHSRVLSEARNGVCVDKSSSDLPAGSGVETLSDQQLISLRMSKALTPPALAAAGGSDEDARCVDMVYEYLAADDMESGIDNDSFLSDFDDVSCQDGDNYENLRLDDGDRGGDEAGEGDCGEQWMSPDDEPVYQELEGESWSQDGSKPHHRESSSRQAVCSGQLSGDRRAHGFHSGKARTPSSAARASISPNSRQRRKQMPVSPRTAFFYLSPNGSAEEAACSPADPRSIWAYRNSSLYALGPAPSPPAFQPTASKNLLSKTRRGAKDLKHKVKRLFAKRECFTPGQRDSKDVSNIVANGGVLEPSSCNQSSLSVSSADDQNASSEYDLGSQSGYSVVSKPVGSRSERQPKTASKEDAPSTADITSAAEEVPRKSAVYQLASPLKKSRPTSKQPSPADPLSRQTHTGTPSGETGTNLESPNRIPSIVIKELKKLDKFQGKAGATSRESENPDFSTKDWQGNEELRFDLPKSPEDVGRGSEQRKLKEKLAFRHPSSGLGLSNAASSDAMYNSTCTQQETPVRNERYDHMTLESLPVQDESIYYNITDNSDSLEC